MKRNTNIHNSILTVVNQNIIKKRSPSLLEKKKKASKPKHLNRGGRKPQN